MSRLDADAIRTMHGETPDAPTQTEPEAPKPQFRPGAKSTEVRPATPGQIDYLRDLVRKRGLDDKDLDVIISQGFDRVSRAIDNLKAMKPVAPTTKQEAVAFIPRTNKYGGLCDRCESWVESNEGILSKADDGKWIVTHREGDCLASEFPFPLGRYAVPTDEGHLAFYHVRPKGLYVQASDTLHRVQANAQQAIIDKIAADPEEASRTYGRELGACGVCGRTLTDEISRAAGIGPICAGRGFAI